MDKLPPVLNAANSGERSASAEKRERIKAALAGGPPDDGDTESEFEVRSQIYEHYYEFAQRHDLRLDFDMLESRDRINIMTTQVAVCVLSLVPK